MEKFDYGNFIIVILLGVWVISVMYYTYGMAEDKIKSRSKNIRDKKDRNQYMQTNLHKKIATAWAKK